MDLIARADRARAILESDAWKEAWDNYRAAIFELIENAPSNDTDKVMHWKRMLAAGKAAREHLELMITDGKHASAEIKFAEDQRKAKVRYLP